jgi:hypothetical protein
LQGVLTAKALKAARAERAKIETGTWRRSRLMWRGSGRGEHPGHPLSDLVLPAALLVRHCHECAVSSI